MMIRSPQSRTLASQNDSARSSRTDEKACGSLCLRLWSRSTIMCGQEYVKMCCDSGKYLGGLKHNKLLEDTVGGSNTTGSSTRRSPQKSDRFLQELNSRASWRRLSTPSPLIFHISPRLRVFIFAVYVESYPASHPILILSLRRPRRSLLDSAPRTSPPRVRSWHLSRNTRPSRPLVVTETPSTRLPSTARAHGWPVEAGHDH